MGTPMQWEYRTERFDTDVRFFSGTTFDAEKMNQTLNALGRDGWELVSVATMPTEVFTHLIYLRRRANSVAEPVNPMPPTF